MQIAEQFPNLLDITGSRIVSDKLYISIRLEYSISIVHFRKVHCDFPFRFLSQGALVGTYSSWICTYSAGRPANNHVFVSHNSVQRVTSISRRYEILIDIHTGSEVLFWTFRNVIRISCFALKETESLTV